MVTNLITVMPFLINFLGAAAVALAVLSERALFAGAAVIPQAWAGAGGAAAAVCAVIPAESARARAELASPAPELLPL